MSEIDFSREAAVVLAAGRTATLATVDEHGRPHAANVQFVHDDQLRVYFVSDPKTAHSRHVARDPRVAMTVYGHSDNRPHGIHGLQLHGRCEALEADPDRRHAWELYSAKFVFVSSDPQMRQLTESLNFYRVTPTWMRLIDNRRGFGWKMERQ
jgi:hypothetical protein